MGIACYLLLEFWEMRTTYLSSLDCLTSVPNVVGEISKNPYY